MGQNIYGSQTECQTFSFFMVISLPPIVYVFFSLRLYMWSVGFWQRKGGWWWWALACGTYFTGLPYDDLFLLLLLLFFKGNSWPFLVGQHIWGVFISPYRWTLQLWQMITAVAKGRTMPRICKVPALLTVDSQVFCVIYDSLEMFYCCCCRNLKFFYF